MTVRERNVRADRDLSCSCCGYRRNDVAAVPVKPVHPNTDRVQVESLVLCGNCRDNPHRVWRLRWQPLGAPTVAL